MRNAIITTVACMSLLLSACQKESLSIDAHLTNLPDGKIYLSVLDEEFQRQTIDTAQITNGQFSFSQSISLDMPECIIMTAQSGEEIIILAANDNITLEGDIYDIENINVSGSESNQRLVDFGKNLPEHERLAQLANEMRLVGGDIDRRDVILEEIKNIQEEQLAYIRRNIYDNKDNILGLFLLTNSIQWLEFDEIDSLVTEFTATLPKHKYVRALRDEVERTRPIYEALKRLEIGCVAPDFTLSDASGKSISLEDLRGKVILLDFWASWCQPCRRNNKTVLEAYNKFADKGFEIVGVSIDNDRDAWLGAVKEDQLPGVQLIDADHSVSQTYCIRQIPATYLLDIDGTIVSKDPGGERLFSDIESLLDKKLSVTK